MFPLNIRTMRQMSVFQARFQQFKFFLENKISSIIYLKSLPFFLYEFFYTQDIQTSLQHTKWFWPPIFFINSKHDVTVIWKATRHNHLKTICRVKHHSSESKNLSSPLIEKSSPIKQVKQRPQRGRPINVESSIKLLKELISVLLADNLLPLCSSFEKTKLNSL